ncbi:MAG: M48 family metalloprotease [Candidatus Omnitrophica bacterium]|nr:M48 family metalloprotease [Candidatus Omnitrophota bacterium]
MNVSCRKTYLIGVTGAFLIAVGVWLSGCATEYNLATNQEESYLITDAREVALGAKLAKRVENKFPMIWDDRLLDKVISTGEALGRASDRNELIYHFGIIDEEDLNAFAIPGGFVYVNRGLLEEATDDELACVLAHEIGHIAAKHSIKRLQSALGFTFLKVFAAMEVEDHRYYQNADMALNELLLAYSRKDELEADRLAVKYVKAAGYHPEAMISFFDKLDEIHNKKPSRIYRYQRTHPYIDDRRRVVRQEIFGQNSFLDYMNKTSDAF